MDTSVRARDADLPSISTIGEDLTITGNVASTGELHVNGRIQGNVHCLALVLGENAQLEGNVVAEDVMVGGRLFGSVNALRVMLQTQAHVEGNLFHKSLAIEQGAHFEGESQAKLTANFTALLWLLLAELMSPEPLQPNAWWSTAKLKVRFRAGRCF
jgi:cytoskeletal protein CcmA (bactofilin family)